MDVNEHERACGHLGLSITPKNNHTSSKLLEEYIW
jgi:hypothetical protein